MSETPKTDALRALMAEIYEPDNAALDHMLEKYAELERETTRPEGGKLTDEQIMNAAVTAADALDATRVSEMRAGGWHATTIFDGDSGLLRFGRLVEAAVCAPSPQLRSQEEK